MSSRSGRYTPASGSILIGKARRRVRIRQRQSTRTLLVESLESRAVLSASSASLPSDSARDYPQVVVDRGEYDPSSILVRFRPGAAHKRVETVLPGSKVDKDFSSVPGLKSVHLGAGNSVEAALRRFRSDPDVLYAEPNYRLHALVTPNDPDYGSLYGMEKISAPAAWDITTGSSDVVVGVIDTGVDYNHLDLAANIWTNPGECPLGDCAPDDIDNDGNGYVDDIHGINAITGSGDPLDDHYHGTHVSGTIGAVGNNAEGVAGVNWNVKIMALKFLNSSGSGTTADAIEAVDYATMMRRDYGVNIRVTSNSWGGGEFDPALLDAINAGGDQGILFVAAAGNDGSDNDGYAHYPSSYDSDYIISVAATDANDNIAYFSNWGLQSVDLGAPGVDTLSTLPGNNYGTLSGTSMATPHVSGVAALAFSLDPGASAASIRNCILGSVDLIDALAVDGFTPVATGGRLNASSTLQCVGMAVASSSPANGAIVTGAFPTSFEIHYSHPVDPETLDATGDVDSDLTVNGQGATGFDWHGDDLNNPDPTSVTYSFGVSPEAGQGVQTMHIAAGAVMTTNGLPDPNVKAWTAKFRYDAVPLTVTTTDPAVGSNITLTGSPLTYVVNFDDDNDLDAASIDASDLTLSVGSVLGGADAPFRSGPRQATYKIGGLSADGVLDVTIAAGAVTDSFGNPNVAFTGSYFLDVGTIDYPAPLVAKSPLGSLIYDPVVSGAIGSSDTDSFTLLVDAGQTITVIVDPAAALQPTIALSGPLGASTSAASAGKDAVLQTVGPTIAGQYTITVGGNGATAGAYQLQVILNAAAEDESHDGLTNNNSPTGAQDINTSSLDLLKGATRVAVLGVGDTEGSLGAQTTAEAFEGKGKNALSAYTRFSPSNASVSTAAAHDGNYGLLLKSPTEWMYRNDANASVKRGDRVSVWMQPGGLVAGRAYFGFGATAAGTLSVVMAPNTGQFILQRNLGYGYEDLAAVSQTWTVDKWYRFDVEWAVDGDITARLFDSDGISLLNTVTGHDDSIASGGIAFRGFDGNKHFDTVQIQRFTPNPDYYSFSVAAGQRVTLALEGLAPGNPALALVNASGAVLASGSAAQTNVDQMIYNFAPATGGTYYARVNATGGQPYSLVVTRGAVFDRERNDSFATAQSMDGVVGALGYLGGEAFVGYFTDNNTGATGPEAAILQAGFVPIHITDISTFDLSTIDILMVNEWDNTGLSSAMNQRLNAIQSWVQGGGVFMVHDRFVTSDVGDPKSNPFLVGAPGILVDRDFAAGSDLDVIAPGGTLVTSGPHGTITNSSLDGGNSSNHGFALGTSLPAGAAPILSAGPDSNHVAAFSYPLGSGFVYYSTIPLDFYLTGGTGQPRENLAKVYTPNMLVYGNSLHPAAGEDWYSITASAGQMLTFPTITPGDGSGAPANNLNPHIELYNPSGVLVATGTPLADGRNESITYVVPSGKGKNGGSGIYRIRVTSEGGTTGDYFLDPIKSVASPAALPAATPTARSAAAKVQPAANNASKPGRAALDSAGVDQVFASLGTAKQKKSMSPARIKAHTAAEGLDQPASTAKGLALGLRRMGGR